MIFSAGPAGRGGPYDFFSRGRPAAGVRMIFFRGAGRPAGVRMIFYFAASQGLRMIFRWARAGQEVLIVCQKLVNQCFSIDY